MQHNRLGPRTLKRRHYRRVVAVVKFRPCEAFVRGERCAGRSVFQRRDSLGRLRRVCEPCAYADEVRFPMLPEVRIVAPYEPPITRTLRPIVAATVRMPKPRRLAYA